MQRSHQKIDGNLTGDGLSNGYFVKGGVSHTYAG